MRRGRETAESPTYRPSYDVSVYALFTRTGVGREAAYKLAEQELATAAEEKLKLNRKIVAEARAVAGTGAVPAFLAGTCRDK